MSSLLATIGKSLGALGNLTVILGIIVYIFAVVEPDQQEKPGDTNTPVTSKTCCCIINEEDYKVDPCLPPFCLCCVRCENNCSACPLWLVIRYKVKVMVGHKYFEWFIVLLIAASSITLAFEDVNINDNPATKEFLFKLNIFFAVIFTVEMLLKFLGLGFVAYFTNPWNWLDFVIVIVVITSLFNAFPGIANVLLVSLMFWLIFSIMGVQSFGGKFYKCLDADGNKLLPSVTPNKTVCLAKGQRWVRSNIHFDDALNGFLALLQVATFEGWMEVMEDAVDATNVDQQPCRECNFVAYWYFVVFIVMGTFFILNLIIGVIIDNFNKLKQQMETVGSMDVFLTASQRNWLHALKSAASKKPKKRIRKPKNKIQGALYDLVQTRKFEVFIMTVITINMVVMTVQHYDQTPQIETTLDILLVLQFHANEREGGKEGRREGGKEGRREGARRWNGGVDRSRGGASGRK
ncbi:hypothetical protein QZH41_000743 [Actinostola sp. cb2023]|nr:hypothetical protein QZH41_000743 [Actinostola sp. cb2023]